MRPPDENKLEIPRRLVTLVSFQVLHTLPTGAYKTIMTFQTEEKIKILKSGKTKEVAKLLPLAHLPCLPSSPLGHARPVFLSTTWPFPLTVSYRNCRSSRRFSTSGCLKRCTRLSAESSS